MNATPVEARSEISLCLDAARAPLLARPYFAEGDPGPIVAALAQVPELMEVALPFISAALGPSAVDWRSKEVVIVRTSVLAGCRFCVQAHAVVALDAGLSHDEVRALTTTPGPFGGKGSRWRCRSPWTARTRRSNDAMRAPQNFAMVVAAIPALVERGVRVRIATTVESIEAAELDQLCALHRSLGVPDEDHIIRPVVARGRAIDHDMGVIAAQSDLPAELTITVDGAFWSPFGPTVHQGVLDTDLLITRTTRPLSVPAQALLRLARGRQAGDDSTLNIR